ncbi:MAG: protein kinase, partial [Gemmatimonadales bacterium]
MPSILYRLAEALLPEYEVEREIASGGMGSVFAARDVALDRRVAVKIIKPELSTAEAAERFVQEAKVLAQIRHPNVVPVHKAGEAAGFFYYVMDFMEGETLADRLKRGPL